MQYLEVTQSRWVIGLSWGPFPAARVPPSAFISQECVRCKEGVWVALIALHTEVSLPSVLERCFPWEEDPMDTPCKSLLGERSPNIIEGLPLIALLVYRASVAAGAATQAPTSPRLCHVMSQNRGACQDET